MKMNKFLTALIAGTVLSGTANAQSVNYGMLEDIFGEPVTTSATGKPQRASEAPVAMEIIDAETIRRSGAKDIPQLLNRVSGVIVQSNANGAADVSIRGYNQALSNRILVLVNGRQVLTDGFGFTPWNNLNVQMNEIRQIEVVKGPNSALFGFNAEQGVINIITFSPLQDDINVAQAKIGTQEHREASVVSTVKVNDNLAVRMSGGYKSTDGFSRDSITDNSLTGGDLSSSNIMDRRQANVDAEWQIDSTSQLRAQISHVNGKNTRFIPFGGSSVARGHNRTDGYQLSYKKQSDYGLWDVTAYRNSYNTQGNISYENDLNVLKVENLYKLNANHAFRGGLEYRYNSITGAMFGNGNSKFDYDLIAPSAMWDWKVSDKLSWTNSVRYDHVDFGRDETPVLGGFEDEHNPFSRKVEEISFNSGALYKLSNTDRVRASIARGMHIPSLIEMGAGVDLAPTPAGFAGDPTLQTERNLTIELGYGKDLPEHNAKVGVNVFWTKLENAISPDIQLGATNIFAFQEAGDSETFGIELEAKGKYNDWLRWGANYSFTEVDDTDNGNNLMFFADNTPTHKVSMYGGFDFCDNWEFDADLHYTSGTDQQYEANLGANQVLGERIDGYFVLNTRVGYNYTNQTSFSLDGYNLVDKHREIAYYNSSTGYGGGNTLGRTILATVNHKF